MHPICSIASSFMCRRPTTWAPARTGRHCISHLVCHPERSAGSLAGPRSCATRRMTTLLIDQMKVDCPVGADYADERRTPVVPPGRLSPLPPSTTSPPLPPVPSPPPPPPSPP